MPIAQINGVRFYYESHGNGFPLVLTWGFGGNTSMWDEQVEAFSRDYRFIIWDPRGHGRSESPLSREQYGDDISAEDLRGLLDRLSIEKAYIGGLSMGGGIAVHFATAHPERVAALLLFDSRSALGLSPTVEKQGLIQKAIELAEAGNMEKVADFILEKNSSFNRHARSSPEAHERLRQMFLTMNPVGCANTQRAHLARSSRTELLSTLDLPTLVLAGEEDPGLEAIRLTHSLIPGSQFVLIPGAGHLSNLDQPDAFNASVLAFLQQLRLPVS